nr:hypothetical protein [Caballeronia glathei]
MNFPSIGDAKQYFDVATACAHFLTGDSDVASTCYHAYRPIGIVLYYAIPFLFTDDEFIAGYITLFLNVLFLLLLIYSGLTLLRRFSPRDLNTRNNATLKPAEVVFVVSATLFPIGFIPVRLSDHQSLALFLTGFCVLTAEAAARGRLHPYRRRLPSPARRHRPVLCTS